ncbi:MAG: hypothetical protein Rubg2KO_35280 [Rubricoccaceae bacterium]
MRVLTVTILSLGLAFGWAACMGPATSAEDASPFLNVTEDVAYVGDAACASCHGELAESYATHGMAQAFYPLTPETAVEDFSGVVVPHEASGFVYVARRDGDRYVQEEYRLGPNGEKTHQLVREMTYVMGSGSAARTYMVEENGRLYELPLTWYTRSDDASVGGFWGFSPGYEEFNGRFDRTVPDRCMACHNGTTTEPVEFANGKYASLDTGISCESCHGPGELHAQARLEDPEAPDSMDVTIVNPKWLSLDLRLDVCQQCHLSGEVSVLRDGESAYSYRPGRPLSAHRALFALADTDPNRVGVISHADRMKESACFIESAAMDCVTCHNPHEGFRDKGPETFNTTCESCHQPDALVAEMPTPELQIQHQVGANCFSCHMPKVTAADVPHASFTDHKVRVVDEADRIIGVASDDRLELVPYFEQDADGGAYTGMAYIVLGRQRIDRPSLQRGASLLADALADEPERGEAQFLLGYAHLQLGNARAALAPLREAIQISENPERLNAMAQAIEQTNGSLAEAETLYRRALTLQPAAASIRVNLGRLLDGQGRTVDALQEYRAAVDEEPALKTAHYNIGTLLTRTGDPEGAQAALEEAVRLDPDYADALANLAVLEAQTGNTARAGRLFERAVAADPMDADAQANLALFYLNAQRPNDAFARAQEALRLNPSQPTAQQVMQILQQAAVPS